MVSWSKLPAILDQQLEDNVLDQLKVNIFVNKKGEAPLGEYDVGMTDIAWKVEKQKSYL